MSIFNVVLNKTVIMMVLIAIGYLLGRRKIVSGNAGSDLAILETRFFLPVFIFSILSDNMAPEKLKTNAGFLLLGAVFLIALLLTSFGISRLIPGSPIIKLVAYFILVYPNFGYFGYPIVEAAFGDEVLSQFIIFALPFTFSINTYGAYMLTNRQEKDGKNEKIRFSLKNLKSLPFEALIAVIIGSICGLFNIALPPVVNDFFDFSAACMSPLSMLLAGLMLSTLSLKQLFRSGHAYIVNALKLIIMPVLTGTILYFIGVRGFYLAFPVIYSAMPVGMNILIFSRPEQADYQSTGIACFISYIFALITVPVIYGILSVIL